MKKHLAILTFAMLLSVASAFAQETDVLWKKNFGGSEYDFYYSVTAISDGVVAVGSSGSDSFGNGDWTGVTGKGDRDAIIVKYDNAGNVVWKKNFGGGGNDEYRSVTAVSDGIVVVGDSEFDSFDNGDWAGVMGRGERDAIIVKYDNVGNVVWKKSFGGSDDDYYYSVTVVPDGIVAVGWSLSTSFSNGDWAGVTGKGGYIDAIIVKYDNAGNVVWKKNFGGSDDEVYKSVTAVSDGIVAVGYSEFDSFDNGDWAGVTGKGDWDAIIVKYDNAGNVVWKKNFGGSDEDVYWSVTVVSDGVIAVGRSEIYSFGNGDWEGIAGKGWGDAIIVKYDNAGNMVWKKNFGGSGTDEYYSVTAVSDGVVTVGYSNPNSFGNGDWAGITGKGWFDAIIVKYLLPVTDITDVPSIAIANIPLPLTGTVLPDDATFQTIIWSIKDAGTTGATITDDNILNTTGEGTIVVTATIVNGTTIGKNYTKDFTITVSTVGIDEVETDNYPSLRMYPNPTTGLLTICDMRYATSDNRISEIVIYDVMGRNVLTIAPVETGRAPSLQSQIENRPSQIEIDISHLPQGVYGVSVISEGRVVGNGKVVKR